MKNSSRKVLVAAALAGLLQGAGLYQTFADSTNAVPGTTAPATDGPKVHGCAGQNSCKGLGGCQSGDHGCKFKNSCKGKGGCEIAQKDVNAWQQKQKDAAKPQI
jgi:hypothetical protein